EPGTPRLFGSISLKLRQRLLPVFGLRAKHGSDRQGNHDQEEQGERAESEIRAFTAAQEMGGGHQRRAFKPERRGFPSEGPFTSPISCASRCTTAARLPAASTSAESASAAAAPRRYAAKTNAIARTMAAAANPNTFHWRHLSLSQAVRSTGKDFQSASRGSPA